MVEKATFGGGCFWCLDAIFSRIIGVDNVTPGYGGGVFLNPTYEDICLGETGHAEIVLISFDKRVISYTELLEIFWQTHDPTTLNRQGADIGTQYRSVIFTHSDFQRKIALKTLPKNAVTEIADSTIFYPAEVSHKDYYKYNFNQGYCQMVISPKLKKFTATFHDKFK